MWADDLRSRRCRQHRAPTAGAGSRSTRNIIQPGHRFCACICASGPAEAGHYDGASPVEVEETVNKSRSTQRPRPQRGNAQDFSACSASSAFKRRIFRRLYSGSRPRSMVLVHTCRLPFRAPGILSNATDDFTGVELGLSLVRAPDAIQGKQLSLWVRAAAEAGNLPQCFRPGRLGADARAGR